MASAQAKSGGGPISLPPLLDSPTSGKLLSAAHGLSRFLRIEPRVVLEGGGMPRRHHTLIARRIVGIAGRQRRNSPVEALCLLHDLLIELPLLNLRPYDGLVVQVVVLTDAVVKQAQIRADGRRRCNARERLGARTACSHAKRSTLSAWRGGGRGNGNCRASQWLASSIVWGRTT